MKTYKFLISICIICVIPQITSATIFIVDNHVPTPAGAYATIQLAHDAASAGDTLMLVPSETEYAGISITKTIHIIGNGWERPATDLSFTKTGGFSISASGVSLQGLKISGDCYPSSNNILLRRNWINGKVYVNATGVNNISIIQNVINSTNMHCIFFNQNTSGIICNNLLMQRNSNSGLNVYCGYFLFPGTYVFKNNVLYKTLSSQNALQLETSGNSFCTQVVSNNVVVSGLVNGTTTPNNNLCNGTQFPSTSNNLQNIDMSSVFVDMANNDYHLKAGSPAIGAGENGTDCGIYGGELGFVDKGVPGLPYIYYLQVPSIANKKDGLNVTVKAKSGN